MHLPQNTTLNTTRPRYQIFRSRSFFTACIILGIFFCWIQLVYSNRPFVVTERNVIVQKVTDISTKDVSRLNVDVNKKIRDPDIATKNANHTNVDLNKNVVFLESKPTLFDREQNYPNSDTSEIFYDESDDYVDTNKNKNANPKDLQNLSTNGKSLHQIPTSKATSKNNQTKDKVHKDMKYILLWTQYDHAPFYFFLEGQKAFIKNNCLQKNCYITTNRTYFDDIIKFDAIAFNGRTMSANSLPEKRSPHQKYIFFNMESAVNFPVCNKTFDGFFNLTATYKLDSDIPFPYIAIKNRDGDLIGPKRNMQWPEAFPEVEEDLAAKLGNKTKAAAWFVSHCNSKSGRDRLVKKLQDALQKYGHTIDIYGKCGTLQCPRNETKKCNKQLGIDYFFYMSLENSFAEDYITEKLLTPLQYDTLPIVYGGANYSRFVPPGSYLDSKDFDVEQLASTMDQLMKNPNMYKQFFRWRSLYRYIDPTRKENVCDVCTAMHRNEKTKPKYDHFRKWWNPNYDSMDCKT